MFSSAHTYMENKEKEKKKKRKKKTGLEDWNMHLILYL